MESLRAILACLLLRSRARREGYSELLYDSSALENSLLDEKYSDFPTSYQDQYQAEDCMTSGTINSNPRSSSNGSNNNPDDDATTGDDDDAAGENLAALAWRIAYLLHSAPSNDEQLQARLVSLVGPTRKWNRKLIEELLDNLVDHIERGRTPEMGDAMLASLDRMTDVADDEFSFPRNHPESVDGFIAIVSVGVLADMLGAWVLELLGFGTVNVKSAAEEELWQEKQTGVVKMSTDDKVMLGDRPKRGSVADWWAREYGEYIPRGGVYSFFKRLDMVEKDGAE